MDRFSPLFQRLHRLLLRRGSMRADAEDLIQDAFIKMQEYCQKGGEVRRPESFLVRTVQRLALNATRDEHHELYSEERVENLTSLIDPNPTPDEVLAGDECLERMREVLDAVSRRTRDVFFLQRIDGYSYAEVAERLGISVSSVEKHMASALAALSDVNELK